jgi:hypothetical protein
MEDRTAGSLIPWAMPALELVPLTKRFGDQTGVDDLRLEPGALRVEPPG